MKTEAKILGLIAAILLCLSVVAKIEHLKGASLGLIVALGLLFPIFLILNIINLVKSKTNSLSFILLGLSFLLFTAGFLFLVMHWPGGVLVFQVGFVASVISLFIAYLTECGKATEEQRFPFLFIVLSIVSVSLIYLGSFRAVSHSLLDGFVTANESSTQTKETLIQITEYSVSRLDSAPENIKAIHDSAIKTINSIEEFKQELAKRANNNELVDSYRSIRQKGNSEITNQLFLAEKKGAELKVLMDNFCAQLVRLNLDEATKNRVRRQLNTNDTPPFDGSMQTWEESKFENVPAMAAIATLSGIQVDILASELLVLQQGE